MLVATSDDQAIGACVDIECWQDLLDPPGNSLPGRGEPLLRDNPLAVINHADIEVELACQAGNRLPDMTSTDNHQLAERQLRQVTDTCFRMGPWAALEGPEVVLDLLHLFITDTFFCRAFSGPTGHQLLLLVKKKAAGNW